MQKPPNHIMDILVVSKIAQIFLFVIGFSLGRNTVEQYVAYTMVLARILKKKMLQYMPTSTSYGSVGVRCKVINMEGSRLVIEHQTPDYYHRWMTGRSDFSCVCSSISNILTSVPTHLREKIHFDADIVFSQEQVDVFLGVHENRFNIIEGPPGCGKTLIARYICEKIGKANSAYISACLALNNRVAASGKVEVFQATNSSQLLELLDTAKQHIVIDDNHNYSYDERILQKICAHIAKTNKHLYIFEDSKFQNYRKQANTLTFKQFLAVNDIYGSCKCVRLNVIRRNAQVVGSFLVAQVKSLDISHEVKCLSPVEGDDIFIKHVKNLRQYHEENGLLRHVQHLLASPLYRPLKAYNTCDIAILVDGNDAAAEVQMFRELFQHFWPASNVQGAEVYPVKGIMIDTLEKFSGLESKIVVFLVPKDTARQSATENAKYRIAVASRGVDRVDFLQEENVEQSFSDKMQFDLIPASVPFRISQEPTHHQEPRLLWTTEAGAEIPSVCWIQDTILYVAETGPRTDRRWEVRLVTVAGDTQTVPMDVSGITPRHVASSADGGTVVVTDADSWTWYSRESPRVYARQQTHRLEGGPWGVCCTDGGVVILVAKGLLSCSLQRHELGDGRLVWQQSVSGPLYSRCLTADPAGRIYLSDGYSIHVYGPDGHRLSSFPAASDRGHITALCADTSGRPLFAGDRFGSVALYIDGERSAPSVFRPQRAGMVESLALYSDMYLAVGTERGGLALYNVEGLLR